MAISAAALVLLSWSAPLVCAAGRPRGGLDELALVQRGSPQGHQAVGALPAAAPVAGGKTPPPPPPSYAVGESVEVKGSGAHAGEWIPCSITGKGEKPHQYAILVPFAGEMQVMAAALRKAEVGTGWWVPSFAPLERVEVLSAVGPLAGSWIQGKVLGQGSLPNTYYLQVPTADIDALPDIPLSSLRKLHEPVVAGCSTVDRKQVLHVLTMKGVLAFAGWSDRCEDFMLPGGKGNESAGVDYRKLDRCVQEVLPVSPMCSLCTADFARESFGTCSAQCLPTASECASFTSPSARCQKALSDCLGCAGPALLSLFQCVGLSDESLPSRLSSLRDAASKRALAIPGVVDSIYGILMDGLAKSVTAPR
mmetsp:Transcript_48322/g.149261  ORF Transcript_48322/g.149261 Transcript_48322/m.149261 type:complete len:365 (+) Transcript_48322:63-1157(+)